MSAVSNSLSLSTPARPLPRFSLVMVLTDDATESFSFSTLLRETKVSRDIITQIDSQRAIEYLRDAEGMAVPELLMLDVKMMHHNDFNFMLHFTSLPEEVRSRVQIVIVSEKYNIDERIMSLMNPYVIGYMIKPIDGVQLREFLVNQ